MRLDTVVRDLAHSVRQILLALSNQLTASENFGPEGNVGEVLTSNGPNEPPSYQTISAVVAASASKTTNASQLVEGILPEDRLQGSYRKITELTPDSVVAGGLAQQNPLVDDFVVPSDYDMLVVSVYSIDGTLSIDGRVIVL